MVVLVVVVSRSRVDSCLRSLSSAVDFVSVVGHMPRRRRSADFVRLTVRRCIERASNRKLLLQNIHNLSRLPLVALCSGSDLAILGLDAIAEEAGVTGDFLNHTASCDSDARCRQFIDETTSASTIWPDMTRLCQPDGMAVNMRTGNLEVVIIDGVLLAGTSCKQFSVLCSRRKRLRATTMSTPQPESCSVSTLQAFLDIVEHHRPLVILLENVDRLFSLQTHGVTVIEVILVRLRRFGYIMSANVVQALEHGHAETRSRAWYGGFLSLLDSGSDAFEKRCQRFQMDVERLLAATKFDLSEAPYTLEDFLFDEDAPPAIFEEEDTAAIEQNVTGQRGLASDGWVHDHGNFERALATTTAGNIDTPPCCSQQELAMILQPVQFLPLRWSDLVRLLCLKWGTQVTRSLVSLHMSLHYVAESPPRSDKHTPCLTPNSVIYHVRRRKVLQGKEHFAVQALLRPGDIERMFPTRKPVRDSFWRHLAGNSFAVGAFCTYFINMLDSMEVDEILRLPDARRRLLAARAGCSSSR